MSICKEKGTYIRIGATNRMAGPEIIGELERQRRHISYDEEICDDQPLDALNLYPLEERFVKLGKSLDKEKLQNLKLIKTYQGLDYPTHALMILLGKYPHCTVKCARFKGTTMDVFIDKKEYSGDVFNVLENTRQFV